ncbi:sensor histidine kinase [Streptomyces sp. NPDC004111]|uniref:sensor histidine kinase n=1 Tax=Streptomyces sp. NPDC004111 TaxID=3364690 RepID=UPI0036A060EB
MIRIFRPMTRKVTYSRWLHLLTPMLAVAVWMYVMPERPWVPALLLVPLGLLPAVRLVEGVQAQLLLTPDERGRSSSIEAVASATWGDRWRTVLWLEIRLVLGAVVIGATVWGPMLSIELALAAFGDSPLSGQFLPLPGRHWWYALLVPLPLLAAVCAVVGFGGVITVIARQLLGASAASRLTALEERTEQLLERNRIARELHDSIGHALTVAVVQAGAARAAGDPEFTDRALAAIEDTGREALEDLERVLGVLRESDVPVGGRPTLAEADRLLDSARASGSEVDVRLSGALATLPGPVSREGYRILQEALTNVLRHAGPVPVRVRIAVVEGHLELDVANPFHELADGPARGSGLHGIRERAALLGGLATTGPRNGEWRVHARLPVDAFG